MRLLFLVVSFFLLVCSAYAQVGVSADTSFTPSSTLDVDGSLRIRGGIKIDSLAPASGYKWLRINNAGIVDTSSTPPTGATGPTGAAGTNGATGPTGVAGTNGATGPTGLLAAGSATGNTTYWDGTQWVLDNNNIYNAGGSVGIGTSSPTVKLDVAGAIKTNDGFIAPNGGITLPAIRFTSDANSGIYRPGSGLLGVVSSGVEVARFTGGGTGIGVLEVNGQGANNQVIVSNHFQQPNEFWFKRAQGNSTAPLLVNNTSVIGSIKSFAYDGTAYRNISNISFEVDGVSGSGDMPGRIVFSTATDGTTILTERMRIANSGALGLSGANYGTTNQVLTSQGSASAPTWAAPLPSVSSTQVFTDLAQIYNLTGTRFSTTSTTLVTVTGASLTLAAGTYLISASAEVQSSSSTPGALSVGMVGGGSYYGLSSMWAYSASYFTWVPWMTQVKVVLASSTTFSVQLSASVGTSYARNVRINATRVQ